jgi:D-arabinose 1-dehydrogenase-like Zn-dependent alcohol dehydrogenase
MKAIRLIKSGSPLEAQDIAFPPVGSRDVLIRVKGAGICHSDAHYRAGISPVEQLRGGGNGRGRCRFRGR